MDQLLTRWPALLPKLEALGLRLLGAVALAALGWLLIRFVVRLTGAALERAHVEPTIAGFVTRLLNATLTVFLIAMLLGVGGLQLASFAALMAGVGIAVGGAMSGLLGDFAAGLLLLVLRPFDVGDEIAIDGAEGEVEEIGVFRTVLVSEQHVRTLVGNAKLLGDVVELKHPDRIVEVRRKVALAPGTDVAAIAAQLAGVEGMAATPAPRLSPSKGDAGEPAISVQYSCRADAADGIGFAINRLLAPALPAAPRRVPTVRVQLLGDTANAA